MNRTLKAIFGVVLGAGMLVSATAQQNFPDVPEYHWAYDAVLKLREHGLLVGYPDGTFKGYRPMSRYEYAVAAWAAYQKLKMMNDGVASRIDGLMSQIDEINRKMSNMGGGTDMGPLQTQLNDLKSQLASLQSDVNSMKSWKDDIDALKKLASTFEQDLASLGVDVAAFKKDLAALDARVTALEAKKQNINISGTMDFYGRAGHSRQDQIGVTWNGDQVGRDAAGNPVGVNKDMHFMNEIGLDLSGEFNGINVVGEVTVGSLLPFEGGTMTQQATREFGANVFQSQPGRLHKSEDHTDVFVTHLEANWNATMMGNGVGIRLGRIGNMVNPYVLKRQDVDYYYDSDRWDNGLQYFDGGELQFKWKVVDLNIFGGRNINRGSTLSNNVYGMRVGDLLTYMGGSAQRPGNADLGLMNVDTLLGANLAFKAGDRVNIGVNYNMFDGANTTWAGTSNLGNFSFNRLAVWGAQVGVNLGSRLNLQGYYSRSDYQFNGKKRLDEDNQAFDVMLNWNAARWGFFAGYRQIGPYYSAPGDWGRIGYWQNPRDIEGFQAGVHFDVNATFSLYASGEFYTGTDKAKDTGGATVGFTKDDKINRIQAGLGYKMGSAWHLGVGWEAVMWDIDTARTNGPSGKTKENYYTADISYDFGSGAMWRFGYQISDYKNETGSGFWNTPGDYGFTEGGPPPHDSKGGLFFTQFSLKF